MGHAFAVVGNWARDGRDKGITVYRKEGDSYILQKITNYDPAVCAGALLPDRDRNLLYVTDEIENTKGGGGNILIYHMDAGSGELTLLQSFPSAYAKPDNLCMTKDKRFLFAVHHGTRARVTKVKRLEDGQISSVTEYGDNGISMFRMNENGLISALCDIGPSGNDSDIPSIMHSFEIDPSGKMAVATDIDRDVISLYRIDEEHEKMELLRRIDDVKGHAPRYGYFHPDLPVYYKNNEQHLSLDSYTYNAAEGTLAPLQTIPYLQCLEGKFRKYEVSDLKASADGRNLYVSVRCSNQIVGFALDERGMMQEQEAIPSGGESPRGICISPDGRYMYIMHDVSKEITCLEIGTDGTLKETGYTQADNCPGVMVFM
ncbi:MAG: beta-propeller fold lactonase family protein [Lachnospiraceae bacterium]|nr:beta-propeller fold lactonase family protein [Lachnospiraceae bacterium]